MFPHQARPGIGNVRHPGGQLHDVVGSVWVAVVTHALCDETNRRTAGTLTFINQTVYAFLQRGEVTTRDDRVVNRTVLDLQCCTTGRRCRPSVYGPGSIDQRELGTSAGR